MNQTPPPVRHEYLEAEVERLLAEHGDIAEQGICVSAREHRLVLSGEVESAARRDEIRRQVERQFPDIEVQCDIGITRSHTPTDAEELS